MQKYTASVITAVSGSIYTALLLEALGFPREASIEPGVASLNAFWWP